MKYKLISNKYSIIIYKRFFCINIEYAKFNYNEKELFYAIKYLKHLNDKWLSLN